MPSAAALHAAFSNALADTTPLPDSVQYMPPGRHRIRASQAGKPLTVEVTVDAQTATTLQSFLAAKLAAAIVGSEINMGGLVNRAAFKRIAPLFASAVPVEGADPNSQPSTFNSQLPPHGGGAVDTAAPSRMQTLVTALRTLALIDFVTRTGDTVALVTDPAVTPFGVLMTDGTIGEQVTVAVAAGGLAGTVRVKLGANVNVPGSFLQLTADGRLIPENLAHPRRCLCALALETGAINELTEAVLFNPVAYAEPVPALFDAGITHTVAQSFGSRTTLSAPKARRTRLP